MGSTRRPALLLAITLLVTAPWIAAAHDAHDGLACGQHHPDVVRQGMRLLGARLAAVEAQEGPAAASAAAAAAAEWAGADGLRMALQEKVSALAKLAAAASTTGKTGGSSSGSSSSSSGVKARRLAASSQAQPAPTSSLAAVPTVPGPLRVKPVFQLGSISAAAGSKVRDVIIPAALAALSRVLKVRAPLAASERAGPFDGRQGCMADYTDGGAAALRADGSHLVLYVIADPDRCFPGLLAFSAPCEIDPVSGRPTVSSLKICPDALATASTGQVIDTVTHEIIHALGFSPTHYPDWRGPDGKRYERPVVHVGPQRAPFLATPKVVAEARNHFGCSSAPGAPLESNGMGMSSLAHWEYRNAQHELMTATRPMDRQRAVLSRLTLAALEDSGWYDVDYSGAAELDWGNGAGCDFILASCEDFVKKNPLQDLYCPPGYATIARCAAGGRLWGTCQANPFTDGCLIVAREAPAAREAANDFRGNFACLPPPAINDATSKVGEAVVDTTTRRLLARLGATGGATNDRCFNLAGADGGAPGAPTLCVSGGPGDKPECTTTRAMCYAAGCSSSGVLSLWIQGISGSGAIKLECPTGTSLNLGTKLTGRFASGLLQCPDNARTCRALSCGSCSPSGGYCSMADGRCHCWLERKGADCSIPVTAA